MQHVRGRLAPSPTGELHLGNAFACMCAWLSVRQQGGTLVLRMEDIDPDRSKPVFVRGVMDDLTWLGINWDAGPSFLQEGISPAQANRVCSGGEASSFFYPWACDGNHPYDGSYIQSECVPRYAAFLAYLEAQSLVYPCFCTRNELRLLASAPHIGDEGVPYPGTCRARTAEEQARLIAAGRRPALRLHTDAAVRFIMEQGGDVGSIFSFPDKVLGQQTDTIDAFGGDFALRRSDGVFAYQLAVVADDAAMGITEVVRGEDLLLSTPRQRLLFYLMGCTPPLYAHVPLVHDSQGERLAKRHKGLALAALREAGVTPQAVVGYIGWLAGLLDKPEKKEACDLIKRFSFSCLRGRKIILPENFLEVMRRVR